MITKRAACALAALCSVLGSTVVAGATTIPPSTLQTLVTALPWTNNHGLLTGADMQTLWNTDIQVFETWAAPLVSPALITPNLGTPSAVTLTNGTGLPVSTGLSGLGTGVATALGVNIGAAGSFTVNGGALGTPSSGVGTNLTGLVYAALPALSANQVLGALTATTPSGQSVPSCSGASNALIWTSGTGFGCNTISGGVTGVSNSDGTLTISPTTGAVVASLATANATTISGAWNYTNAAGVTISSPSEEPFALLGKPGSGMFGFEAVALLLPGTNNRAMTLDLTPRGTPTEFGFGSVWIDLSDRQTGFLLPLNSLHLSASFANSRIDIDSTTFNPGSTPIPMYVGQFDGDAVVHNDTFVVNTDGTYQELNGVAKQIRTVTAAGAVTVAITDHVVCINKGTGAATAANLFATPRTGADIVIKDCKGDAAANNITVTPAAGNIDGAGTFVISTNYGAWEGTYNGAAWSTVATH